MKFKSLLLVIILLCTAFIMSCGNGKDNWIPKGMKIASTDAVDYILFVPDTWTVDISTGVVSAYTTDRSNITMIAFNLENENKDLTPDGYWKKYEPELRQTFPDMEYSAIQNGAETTGDTTEISDNFVPVTMLLDGLPANKYIYTATVTGVKYQYMQVICTRGGIAYLFTYTSIPQNFDIHLDDVNRILENFRFDQ